MAGIYSFVVHHCRCSTTPNTQRLLRGHNSSVDYECAAAGCGQRNNNQSPSACVQLLHERHGSSRPRHAAGECHRHGGICLGVVGLHVGLHRPKYLRPHAQPVATLSGAVVGVQCVAVRHDHPDRWFLGIRGEHYSVRSVHDAKYFGAVRVVYNLRVVHGDHADDAADDYQTKQRARAGQPFSGDFFSRRVCNCSDTDSCSPSSPIRGRVRLCLIALHTAIMHVHME